MTYPELADQLMSFNAKRSIEYIIKRNEHHFQDKPEYFYEEIIFAVLDNPRYLRFAGDRQPSVGDAELSSPSAGAKVVIDRAQAIIKHCRECIEVAKIGVYGVGPVPEQSTVPVESSGKTPEQKMSQRQFALYIHYKTAAREMQEYVVAEDGEKKIADATIALLKQFGRAGSPAKFRKFYTTVHLHSLERTAPKNSAKDLNIVIDALPEGSNSRAEASKDLSKATG